jgi:hypothetical protein
MKAYCTFSVLCSVLLAFDAPAIAATLTSIQGTIQVNGGSGFHQVAGVAEVAPGTSVMAGPQSSAEVLYSDGCRIPVRPGSVAVVAPISPCAQGQADPGQVPQTPDYTSYYIMGGAVAIAVGVAVAIPLCCASKSAVAPASP